MGGAAPRITGAAANAEPGRSKTAQAASATTATHVCAWRVRFLFSCALLVCLFVCERACHFDTYLSIYLSISLSLSLYIYIYIYIHIYIYTYTHV